MFKIYDSTPVGSNDDVDRWTIYLKALAVKLIGSSLVKKTNASPPHMVPEIPQMQF